MILTKAQPRIEARGVDVNTHHILINGEHIDTVYGTPIHALEAVEMWRESVRDCPLLLDWLNIPINELPDWFWKNGHEPPLRLDDGPIPFEGEPVEGDEDTARSRYGLGSEYR